MAEAKHSFVDDNPYIVYSPNAETTSEGGSGGLVVVTADTGGYPSMSAEEIAENANAGKLVVFKNINNSDSYNLIGYNQLSAIVIRNNNTIAIFSNLAVNEGEEEGKTVIEGSSITVSTKETPIVVYAYLSD